MHVWVLLPKEWLLLIVVIPPPSLAIPLSSQLLPSLPIPYWNPPYWSVKRICGDSVVILRDPRPQIMTITCPVWIFIMWLLDSLPLLKMQLKIRQKCHSDNGVMLLLQVVASALLEQLPTLIQFSFHTMGSLYVLLGWHGLFSFLKAFFVLFKIGSHIRIKLIHIEET